MYGEERGQKDEGEPFYHTHTKEEVLRDGCGEGESWERYVVVGKHLRATTDMVC